MIEGAEVNQAEPVADQQAAISIGRVGSRDIVEIGQIGYITAPDGSIGISAKRLIKLSAELLGTLDEEPIIWISDDHSIAENAEKLKLGFDQSSHAPSRVEVNLANGAVTVDLDNYRLLIDGKETHLPKQLFEVLSTLVKKKGVLVRREEMIREVWGDWYGSPRTLDVAISNIRRTLGEYESMIKTRRGYGYMVDDSDFTKERDQTLIDATKKD